ncbi:GntR family transcriptional regulator [Streptomyces mirabilis]|uniref:GntR family transcriptional regulator n=1 Tax=Streptomyces mirabilis TaxID=68239 RepID=UPI0036C331BE
MHRTAPDTPHRHAHHVVGGELPPRTLISEVQMEAEFGVARGTVRKATAALREEGLIVTTPGMGSFVADQQ